MPTQSWKHRDAKWFKLTKSWTVLFSPPMPNLCFTEDINSSKLSDPGNWTNKFLAEANEPQLPLNKLQSQYLPQVNLCIRPFWSRSLNTNELPTAGGYILLLPSPASDGVTKDNSLHEAIIKVGIVFEREYKKEILTRPVTIKILVWRL